MASAEEYFAAAKARLGDAQVLTDARQWSGAAYMAGRAAEAMLRALLRLKTASNEAGHDLRDLLKQIDRVGMLTPRNDDRLTEHLEDLGKLWHNNLRYADDAAWLRQIKAKGLDRRVKGEPTEVWARRLVRAGEAVVSRGAIVWQRSK